jgi:hypothetical protein
LITQCCGITSQTKKGMSFIDFFEPHVAIYTLLNLTLNNLKFAHNCVFLSILWFSQCVVSIFLVILTQWFFKPSGTVFSARQNMVFFSTTVLKKKVRLRRTKSEWQHGCKIMYWLSTSIWILSGSSIVTYSCVQGISLTYLGRDTSHSNWWY